VDGFVEAPNSTTAIDRLADRGIIGVYTVRPEPKPPKNAVRLDGDKTPDEDEKPVPRLEAPAPPPTPSPAPVKTEPGAEVVFSSLVDKLGTLLTQVEKLLSRPPQQQVIYQNAGPARDRDSHSRPRRVPQSAASSTLRDIFQTNLDLRQSLEKLASNTGTANRMTEVVGKVAEAATRLTDAAVESSNGEPVREESNPGAGTGTEAQNGSAHDEIPQEDVAKAPRESASTRELVQPVA
jgi:hypothetical protein